MLIALAIMFISLLGFGAAGLDALDDRIEATVDDPVRLAAAQAAVRDAEALSQSMLDQVDVTTSALREVHLRRDATRQDYLDAFQPLKALRNDVAYGLLDTRVRLREALSDEEWREVFPPEDP